MSNPNSIFYFTTNNLHGVDGGVQSRCHLINMEAAPSQAWIKLFSQILIDRGASIPSAQTMLPLIDACNGCVRDIVTAAQVLAAKRIESGHTIQAAANADDAEQDAA
ncbi:hypothetical protein [Novosphingobium humi]|uniref:hypothetical protein n=1 Tax=Novosphingobium humi TaxID=2282397 RepID=UPI0025B07AF5|nr:hypothetical protein [Novosphingobium humi]WJS99865.1 hypothetical protein NYQ05_06935 [Novosphingobium humi]